MAWKENLWKQKSLQRCKQRSPISTTVWSFIIQEPFDDVKVTDKLWILWKNCEHFAVLPQAEQEKRPKRNLPVSFWSHQGLVINSGFVNLCSHARAITTRTLFCSSEISQLDAVWHSFSRWNCKNKIAVLLLWFF